MTGREAEGPRLKAEIQTASDGGKTKLTEALSSRGRLPLRLRKNHRRQPLRFGLALVTRKHLRWGVRECRPLCVAMETEDVVIQDE